MGGESVMPVVIPPSFFSPAAQDTASRRPLSESWQLRVRCSAKHAPPGVGCDATTARVYSVMMASSYPSSRSSTPQGMLHRHNCIAPWFQKHQRKKDNPGQHMKVVGQRTSVAAYQRCMPARQLKAERRIGSPTQPIQAIQEMRCRVKGGGKGISRVVSCWSR